MMKFLCFYTQELEAFRLAELKAICRLFDIEVKLHMDSYQSENPYLIIEVNSTLQIEQILSRSVLVKSISEYWADGKDFSKLAAIIKKDDFDLDCATFKFVVENTNKKLSLEDRVAYMEEFQKHFPLKGEVDLKSPEKVFTMLLHFNKNDQRPNRIYFGKLVGTSARFEIHKYNLKTRYFIGNTSMDPQLALIMANCGLVKNGSLCYDPFVGTGSIIVACSHFGGFAGGNDINYNVVFGRGKSSRAGNNNFRARDEIARTNFINYDLAGRYWDVMACDATRMPMRPQELFDAIITDPPYGIREGGRKLGSKKEITWDIPDEVRDEHIPAKKQHSLSSIVSDLLEFAHRYLCVGGMLVYWLPVYTPSYCEEMVPRHLAFQVISNCEQCLTKTISRRLITMKKIRKYDQLQQIENRGAGWSSHQDSFRDNYFSKTSESLEKG